MKYYAGIGSRNTPQAMLDFMSKISAILEQNGYVLRSGGAKGADTYFAKGSSNKEIFKSSDAKPWSFDEVKKHLPNDRPPTFDSWDPYIKGLLARNMMQVLGENGDSPVEFIVCWTPQGDYNSSDVGGTGYAIRCANAHGIKVYNLGYKEQLDEFKNFIRELYARKT